MALIIISIVTAFIVSAITALVCCSGRITLNLSAIPRNRILGLAIGVAVLSWSAYEGALMLPAAYTPWCWAAVPVVTLLCHFFLDFTAARAFGGLLVLLTNFMIQNCFAEDVRCRLLYGIIALVWGLAGICLIAWPWWLRDAFTFFRTPRAPWMKRTAWAAGVASALIFIILPLL